MRKYLRKLIEQMQDDSFVVIELYLLWIGFALTFLVIATVLYYIQ